MVRARLAALQISMIFDVLRKIVSLLLLQRCFLRLSGRRCRAGIITTPDIVVAYLSAVNFDPKASNLS